MWCLRSLLGSASTRGASSCLRRPSAFPSNSSNVMCLPVNCPRNLLKSGMWRVSGFRLPHAQRLQSNYCCVYVATPARAVTREPRYLARAFFNRVGMVTRGRLIPSVGLKAVLLTRRTMLSFHTMVAGFIYVFVDLSSCLSACHDTIVNDREETTHAHTHTHYAFISSTPLFPF